MPSVTNRWADLDLDVANPLSSSTLPFTGGARHLGDNFPNRTWKTAYNKFGPRIGLAFQASDRAVPRGGYALMYLPTSQRFYGTSTLGYSQQTQTVYTSTNTPTATTANPFPNGAILPAGPAAGVTAGTRATSVGGAIYNNPLPYFQQINAGVETQIAQGVVLHLNYVGSHGVHLPINYRPNDLRDQYWGNPGSQSQIDYLNAPVANPFWASLRLDRWQRQQRFSAYSFFRCIRSTRRTMGCPTPRLPSTSSALEHPSSMPPRHSLRSSDRRISQRPSAIPSPS